MKCILFSLSVLSTVETKKETLSRKMHSPAEESKIKVFILFITSNVDELSIYNTYLRTLACIYFLNIYVIK